MSLFNLIETILAHPVTLAVLTALLGIVTFAYQAYRKRRDERRERKRLLYESLIAQVFRLIDAQPGAESSAVMTEIEKSWLFASDEVLNACYEVFEAYEAAAVSIDGARVELRKSPETRRRFGAAVGHLFVAIRRDLRGRQTRIDDAWACKRVKVYEWGAPHADRDKKTDLKETLANQALQPDRAARDG